jgi:DNA-binding MarR family transcriptional regulator
VQATEQSVLSRQLGIFVGYVMQTYGRDVVQIAAENDISFTQLKALHALFNATELSVKELGDSLGLSVAAMSRAADGLVQRGLFDRTEDPEDRRIKRLRLTDEGNELVRRMREGRMAGFEEFVDSLSPKERAALAKTLELITARDDVKAFCGGPR